MNITTTGIAVAIAIVVIAVIFIFPNLSPFSTSPTATSTSLSVGQNQASSTPQMYTNSDGLQVTDEVVGTGATAQVGDSVTVNYVGSLTNGTVFDASANHGSTGFTFTLGAGQVISGWDEGIVGMKVGGTRKLVIPPALGYGSQSVATIPPNSTLVFEVQLISVSNTH